jgi:hypothetical protein
MKELIKNLEELNRKAEKGGGDARLKYDKYARGDGGEKLGHNTRNYFGPTKIGLSFIYVIK